MRTDRQRDRGKLVADLARSGRVAQEIESPGRLRIVESAAPLFTEEGYSATSMKAIADDVGVSAPAIYWHFASKRALYLAVLEYLLKKFVTDVLSQMTAVRPEEQLRQLAAAHVRWRLERQSAAGVYSRSLGWRELVRALPQENRDEITKLQRAYLCAIRNALETGRRQGLFHIQDVKVMAFAIVSICDNVTAWYDANSAQPPTEVAATIADHVVAMAEGESHTIS